MFLRGLIITCDGKIVRDIQFKRGMNLIVDQTDPGLSQESGNNVGKTTVLRLVNYCLGGDEKSLYADPEFKEKRNEKIKEYLHSSNVTVSLRLAKDLDYPDADDIVIERNFQRGRGERIRRINGIVFSNDQTFAAELNRRLFGLTVPKPTTKQIVAKNIREGSIRTEHILHVLSPYTTGSEYEALFLFLLGVTLESAVDKQKLLDQLKAENNLLRRLDSEGNESQIEQALAVIDRRITTLEDKRNALNVNPNYRSDLATLDSTRQATVYLAARLGKLELRKQLLEDGVHQVRQEASSVEPAAVKRLYEEASALIQEVQHSFEETLAFHNRMVGARVAFLQDQLPDLDQAIRQCLKELREKEDEESRLAEKVRASDSFEMVDQINQELYESYRMKGQREESRRMRLQAEEAKRNISSKLDTINGSVQGELPLIDARIEIFNGFFSDLSTKVYGEQFILSRDWSLSKATGEKSLTLKVTDIDGNPGTGKKLGQIALFDLAYIDFADFVGIPCLHFVLQDRMENVHDNQLHALTEVVRTTNCQYILTVLQDKLPEDILNQSYVALRLSQDDKLFRIP